MRAPSIVIVDDDKDILELLEYHFLKEKYEVTGFLHTKMLEQFLYEERVDLIVMDRNLNGIEGSKFIADARKNGLTCPVIYLSAKSSDEEIEEGFLSGGDDYIVKPFNICEVLLRVKNLLKRTGRLYEIDATLEFEDIILYPRLKKVTIMENEIELFDKEFLFLQLLMHRPNMIHLREDIMQNVWGSDLNIQNKTLNVLISRLIKKLDPTKEKNYIRTYRGIGYSLGDISSTK